MVCQETNNLCATKAVGVEGRLYHTKAYYYRVCQEMIMAYLSAIEAMRIEDKTVSYWFFFNRLKKNVLKHSKLRNISRKRGLKKINNKKNPTFLSPKGQCNIFLLLSLTTRYIEKRN